MRRGFTLIELLIVVAIIAILAAIAVPNFMEAQVRSKVSRVHADMRSLATAIEAYTVDYNRPPISAREYSYGINPGTWSWYSSHWYLQLTTPVSYISDAPADPFTVMMPTIGGYPSSPGWGIKAPGSSFNYAHFGCSAKLREAGNDGLADTFDKLVRHSLYWSMDSAGPSRVYADTSTPGSTWMTGYTICLLGVGEATVNPGYWVGGTYDPTNGTMSRGFIVRTNQGVLSAPGNR